MPNGRRGEQDVYNGPQEEDRSWAEPATEAGLSGRKRRYVVAGCEEEDDDPTYEPEPFMSSANGREESVESKVGI